MVDWTEIETTVTCHSYPTPMQRILKNVIFYGNGGWTQSLHFWSNFDLPHPLKMAEIEKKEIFSRKNLSYWAIQIFQSQGPISSLLYTKNRITFSTFCFFGAKNKMGSKVKESQSKSNIA